MITNVAILGAGRFAQVAAGLLSRSPAAKIRVWARDVEKAGKQRWPEGIDVLDDMAQVADLADLVLVAVVAGGLEETLDRFGPHARGDQIVVHGCRGVGPGFRLPHQMLRETTCIRKIGVLGGPLSSEDLQTARLMPLIMASRFDETFAMVKNLTKDGPLSLHTSRDVVGVEMAGAISNVNAIAQGMAEACEFGDTARGLLLAHGLADAQRLGVRCGAAPQTFTGIAALGDLIPRHVSSTDRHRAFGKALAAGSESGDSDLEGVVTVKEAAAFAARQHIDIPLISAVQRVVEGSEDARSALEAVLSVDLGALGVE